MKRALQWLITAGVTWLILTRLDLTWQDAVSPELSLPPGSLLWLMGATASLLLGFLVSARLWGRMVGELGARDPGCAASARIFLAANLGRYIPGKVWQVAGLAILSRRSGVPATVATTAGVLGQLFALGAAAVVASPLLARVPSADRESYLIPGLILAVLLLLISTPGLLHRCLALAFRAARIPITHLPELDAWFGPRWIALHLIPWVVYGFAFVLFVRGLGFEGGFIQFAPPFAAAYLLGYLAVFAPAGIGVREGFLVAFLPTSVGSGALVIAVLSRLWMTAAEVIPAGGLAIWEVQRSPRTEGARPPPAPEKIDASDDGS